MTAYGFSQPAITGFSRQLAYGLVVIGTYTPPTLNPALFDGGDPGPTAAGNTAYGSRPIGNLVASGGYGGTFFPAKTNSNFVICNVGQGGYATVLNTYNPAAGGYAFLVTGRFFVNAGGYAAIGVLCTTTQAGYATVLNAFTPQARGVATIQNTFHTGAGGVAASVQTFVGLSVGGRYRVANAAVAGYAVYVGMAGPPDYAAGPAVTGATLPLAVTVTPPLTGTQAFWVVTRAVDVYGLESQNQYPTIITVDSSGHVVLGPISDPTTLRLYPTPGPGIRILANYPGLTQDTNPADTWLVWVATGVPDTGTTPTATVPVSAVGTLSTTVAVAGGPYNVAVRLLRTEDTGLSAAITGTVVVPAVPAEPVPVAGPFSFS